jgi:hypothetical protein
MFMPIHNHTRTGLAILLTVAVSTVSFGACASEPQTRPTVLDPSNPAAPESTPLMLAAIVPIATEPPAAAGQADERTLTRSGPDSKNGLGHKGSASVEDNRQVGEGGKAGKQAVVLYTCPMHPEVISDKPGRCPKCGMKLVPKEPTEGKK